MREDLKYVFCIDRPRVRFSEFLYERILPLSMESDLIFLGDFNLPQSVVLESFFDGTLLTQLTEESTTKEVIILTF